MAREHLFYNAIRSQTRNTYRELRRVHRERGSWEAVWEERIGLRAKPMDPEVSWRALEASGIRLILADDADYPAPLRETAWPPFGIYVKGALPDRHMPLIGIVGTRKATGSGRSLAEEFARTLARSGVAIISGLALGIDAAAHHGALEASGTTLAVLANGLDEYYPRTNHKLAEEILKHGGALVSEYAPGTAPLPHQFLERNRIVSGLARGVLIIEAPERSGSLATARFALESNRDVFAVPGPSKHPNFKGSHALIRAGAELVTEPEDILSAWGLGSARGHATTLFETAEEQAVADALRTAATPLPVDKIIELTRLNAHTVNQALALLELKHGIKEEAGGYTLL